MCHKKEVNGCTSHVFKIYHSAWDLMCRILDTIHQNTWHKISGYFYKLEISRLCRFICLVTFMDVQAHSLELAETLNSLESISPQVCLPLSMLHLELHYIALEFIAIKTAATALFPISKKLKEKCPFAPGSPASLNHPRLRDITVTHHTPLAINAVVDQNMSFACFVLYPSSAGRELAGIERSRMTA